MDSETAPRHQIDLKGINILTTFQELNLSEPILRALTELGYEEPTPIQAQTIIPMQEGKDLIAQAQTGTGKTAAFALPLDTARTLCITFSKSGLSAYELSKSGRKCLRLSRRQRVQIGDEVIRLIFVLQGNVLADGAEVIAPVEAAGRLNAGKNTHRRCRT